jgi:hypothetical protein
MRYGVGGTLAVPPGRNSSRRRLRRSGVDVEESRLGVHHPGEHRLGGLPDRGPHSRSFSRHRSFSRRCSFSGYRGFSGHRGFSRHRSFSRRMGCLRRRGGLRYPCSYQHRFFFGRFFERRGSRVTAVEQEPGDRRTKEEREQRPQPVVA